jgi:enoyl-CoA hydratase/carnithine racemase
MYEPAEAAAVGFLDRAVPAEAVDAALGEIVTGLKGLHAASHALAKQRLRRQAAAAIREAIDRELTPEAYRSGASMLSSVVLPA